MKAAELVRHEPFPELLTSTMSGFLALRFGGQWRVQWNDSVARTSSQKWLVNLNINAIFRDGAHPGTLEVVRREFGTSVVRWKRPLQRIYFWLATSYARDLMSHASLEVDPPVPEAENWLVVPGTHKIRFVDSRSEIVYCCRKSGASAVHFQSELASRRFAERNGVPVPQILTILSSDCIAERLVLGTPLNRLLSQQEQANGLKIALEALEPLYRASRRVAGISTYAAELFLQVRSAAESCRAVASSIAPALAQQICDSLTESDDTVELVRAHGDFQPGNILYDRGKVWLIDWEYSKERQRAFDLMTYNLRARFTAGLSERLAASASHCSTPRQSEILRLFILETILFECEAATVSSSADCSHSLNAKLAAIEKALPQLLRCGLDQEFLQRGALQSAL